MIWFCAYYQFIEHCTTAKRGIFKRIASMTRPTTPSYKKIIPMNEGEKDIPSSLKEIHQLERRPNRCSA
jgi:hypothetical protein